MVKKASLLAAAVLCVFCWRAAGQNAATANYDEAKAGHFTLPNPLVFKNGKPVRNASDWARRRREIIEMYANSMYGHSAAPPAHTRFRVFEQGASALGGTATRRQVTIYFSARADSPHEDLLIYIPAGATQPVPMILSLNFVGNQSVVDDPGVKLATVWNPKTHQSHLAPEQSRGRDPEFEVAKVLARGYGFATICYQDIEPDFDGGVRYGIQPLFYKPGQTQPGPADWGAIGAWAYGLSRAMDYLETDKAVDAKRVAIMGHSRLGKTVLWAGALDTRFAMVLSSCSGRGGASLARRNYGETIHSMCITFPYWFCRNLQQYADHTDRLPVDSNELIALMAPRPVYITGAEDDKWGDPRGEFLAAVGASPVFQLLGAEGLGTDKMPPLNQPIMHTLAFHIRDGKHAVTAFDWDQFLKFADKYLRAQ
jgi:hypothetical protein